ncbi:glycosyltransferase, partial [TM7 phylum sp. oral taxon 356]
MKAITQSLGLSAATGDSQQFRPLNPQTLTIDIVLPVLNEAHIIEASISKLHKYLTDNLPYRWQIIIADNGSSDGTYQIAQQLTKRWSRVRLVHLNERGRGLALKTVWQKSKADILAYMDIDLSTNLDSFMPMISPLITGDAGLATGSRLMKESRTRRGFKREIISRCYNRIIRTTMNTNFVDAQCGFKAIRRDLAQKLLPHIKDKAWFFDTELLVKAEYEGYKIHEEPVEWIEDADSRVRIVETAADDIKGLSRVRKEYGKSSFGEMAAFGGLLLFTSIFYLWNLTINGMANSYYAAAAQAASTSWLAWLFGSLDAANFVSVDKPPISMMIMGLFGRLFGFSSWSMLLPHALAGIATVALVYLVVRRWYGARAGLIAGVVMALTPAAALMFRFNNPDSFLTLFLTASAYSFLRAFEGSRPVLWLSLAGLFTGFAFNTKMLQGLLLLPIMTIIYISFARPKFTTRMWHLGVAGIATIVSTFWWSILVWLTPAVNRPWVGSTSDNSIWSLIFGY